MNFKKNFKKSRRKILREQYEDQHPHHTEGHWEDVMLENNSYYDIDLLHKHNKPIYEKIKYWEDEFKPSGNMGKWWASIQIEKLRKKIKHYQ